MKWSTGKTNFLEPTFTIRASNLFLIFTVIYLGTFVLVRPIFEVVFIDLSQALFALALLQIQWLVDNF